MVPRSPGGALPWDPSEACPLLYGGPGEGGQLLTCEVPLDLGCLFPSRCSSRHRCANFVRSRQAPGARANHCYRTDSVFSEMHLQKADTPQPTFNCIV